MFLLFHTHLYSFNNIKPLLSVRLAKKMKSLMLKARKMKPLIASQPLVAMICFEEIYLQWTAAALESNRKVSLVSETENCKKCAANLKSLNFMSRFDKRLHGSNARIRRRLRYWSKNTPASTKRQVSNVTELQTCSVLCGSSDQQDFSRFWPPSYHCIQCRCKKKVNKSQFFSNWMTLCTTK